jgi:hypothetical protein
MARSGKGNKYGQQSDEHPRPHIDVPMSIFGESLFAGRPDLVGQFVHHWCHCVWKKDPAFFGVFLNERELRVAIDTGFLVNKKGKLRMTGPYRDQNWLLDLPREWWTYAIEAVGSMTVKIGRSINPDSRFLDLQKCSPLPLRTLGKRRGDVEGALHSELSAHRISGEWFRLNEDVMAALADWKVIIA